MQTVRDSKSCLAVNASSVQGAPVCVVCQDGGLRSPKHCQSGPACAAKYARCECSWEHAANERSQMVRRSAGRSEAARQQRKGCATLALILFGTKDGTGQSAARNLMASTFFQVTNIQYAARVLKLCRNLTSTTDIAEKQGMPYVRTFTITERPRRLSHNTS